MLWWSIGGTYCEGIDEAKSSIWILFRTSAQICFLGSEKIRLSGMLCFPPNAPEEHWWRKALKNISV